MSVHTLDHNKPIDVETSQDLTGASVGIRAIPPNAKRNAGGTWTPVYNYSGTIQSTTKIRHTKTTSTFNVVGVWRVQAKVTFAGSEVEYGDEATLQVYPSF